MLAHSDIQQNDLTLYIYIVVLYFGLDTCQGFVQEAQKFSEVVK